VAAHLAAGIAHLHDGFPDLALEHRRRDPGAGRQLPPHEHPTGVYRTKDGHINIAVFGGKIWERFAEAMGAPEWITDERSKSKANRSVHRDWLNAEIEKRLLANTSEYWIETLNKAGVACGRINNIQEPSRSPRCGTWGCCAGSPRLGSAS
jgi:formyl-CoA transferase